MHQLALYSIPLVPLISAARRAVALYPTEAELLELLQLEQDRSKRCPPPPWPPHGDDMRSLGKNDDLASNC